VIDRAARLLVLAFLLTSVLLTATGCDEESSPSVPTRKVKPAAQAESPVGRWELDPEGFLEQNWSVFLARVQPTIDGMRLAEARIAALPEEEQAVRRAEIDARKAKLPKEQRDMVEAALEGPEALKARLRPLLAEKMPVHTIQMDFVADGTCTLDLNLPDTTRQRASGTWTANGASLTIQLLVVNGKPAKGNDKKPASMTLRNGQLRYKRGDEPVVLVARRVAG
jgi:hypothetical protein